MISAWEEERNNGVPPQMFFPFCCPCCSPEYCRWNTTEEMFASTLSTEARLQLSQIGLKFTALIRTTR